MNLRFKLIIIFLIFGSVCAQQKYLSPEDVKVEWKNYTTFQRQELVNFATFLYDEEFYERALLVYFQFLYKYPGDELEMAAYFKIGKCYEMMGDWDLAKNYYNRIIERMPSESVASKAAKYQLYYISLETKDHNKIVEKTFGTTDPYDLIFRAYAHFEMLEWEESKLAFKSAQAAFDHGHYTKLIKSWYSAIKTAENAPLKSKTPALLSSLFPGGGFLYLKQKENAIGTMGASFLITAAIISSSAISQKNKLSLNNNKQMVIPMSGDIVSKEGLFHSSSGYLLPGNLKLSSNKSSIIVPPAILLLGLYSGSIWKSVHDIDAANKKLTYRFTERVTKKLSINRFMDYEIPDFIIK